MNCNRLSLSSGTTLILAFILLCACGSGTQVDVEQAPAIRPPPTNLVGNSAPTISGVPSSTVGIGELYSFTPIATDSDGDSLTFSIENPPRWIEFNSTSGRISGIPGASDVGVYENISISVSDGSISSSLTNFTITVNQSSTGAVTLSWTAPTKNNDGSNLTNLAGYEIYYGIKEGNYTRNIRINNPGITTYVVEGLSPNTYYFVIAAFNSNDITSENSNVASKTVK